MFRYRLYGLAVGLIALGASSCDHQGGALAGLQKREGALTTAAWVVPPVLQQTHTLANSTSDFSVLYVAVGGGCNDTTSPCVSTTHRLFFRVHGSGAWQTATLPAWPSGEGYVLSAAHMGDGSVDCQKPGEGGDCGTNTTFYDLSWLWSNPLEVAHPPWKVIKVGGLVPDTTYDWYVHIDGDSVNFADTNSAVATVKTPPLRGSLNSFKFVFNSDPQESTPGDHSGHGDIGKDDYRKDNVLSAIATYSKPAFMMSGGDLNLNGGGPKVGQHWFNDLKSGSPSIPTQVLSTIPFFPAFGNHDWMAAGSLDRNDCCEQAVINIPNPRNWNYTPTAAMMYGYTTGGLNTLGGMYTAPGAPAFVPYYSFDWGNSHFLMLSSGPDNKGADWNLLNGPNVYKQTPNVGFDNAQFAFAKADLEAASANPSVRHIFVAMHDPIFHTSGDSTLPTNYAPTGDTTSPPPSCGPHTSCTNSVSQLADLFENNRVDMVLGGHLHTYSRIQDGPTWYVTAGIAGGPIDDVQSYPGTGGVSTPPNGCNTSGHMQGAAVGCVGFPDDGSAAHRVGTAMQFWGYVEITVDNDQVTYSAKQVIPGTGDGSPVNPPPPPTEVDHFTWGLNPPVNVAMTMHDPVTASGGVDIKYNVLSANSGTTWLYTSLTGKPNSFTYQSGFETPYTGNNPTAQYTIHYPNVTPGQTLYVQLVNDEPFGAGTSGPSTTVSMLIPACAMPPVTITSSSNGNLLSWPNTYTCNGVSLLSYSVYRWDDTNNLWNGIGSSFNTNSFLDKSWNCATGLVEYKVVAWTNTPQNQIVFSLPAYANADDSPWSTLCSPTNLVATQVGQGKVDLKWSNNGETWDTLYVERGVGKLCNNTVPIGPISPTATSWEDQAALADTIYCYSLEGIKGGAYYFSNTYKLHTWKSFSPSYVQASNIGPNKVAVNWGYPFNSGATSTTLYRSLDPSDPTKWEEIITLPNNPVGGYIVGNWVDAQSSANLDFNHWWEALNTDATYYYRAVGHVLTPTADPDQSVAPDDARFSVQLTDNPSLPGPTASITPLATSGCAGGEPDTIFSPGVESCPGHVAYPDAATLCAAGYHLCSAAEWDGTFRADGHKPPVNNYWVSDNLGYAGAGPNNCSVSGTAGNCGTNDPMRVCGATSDAQGNACNWTGCGYQTNSVNGSGSEYFGGCSGNLTAGALCCLSAASACSSGASATQGFAPGVVGCAGKVTWDRRNDLCGAGCAACSASQYVQYFANTPPRYDYWTNDNLGYSGSSNACGAYTSGGTSCGTNDPMRVCVPGTTTDPLGNVCNWHDCGFNGIPPLNTADDYFGGCSGNLTAGTLCCCDQ